MPYIIFVIALIFTAAVCFVMYRSISENDEARFYDETERVKTAIRTRIEMYRGLLRAGAGLFVSDRIVSPDEFLSFYKGQQLERQFPGIQGIGYARRTPLFRVDSLVQAMRQAGRDDFHVFPETPHDERYPIIYLEPLNERNRAAVGYDMYAETERHNAMTAARDSGRGVMTGKVRLQQEVRGRVQAGFLIYEPVYAGGTIPPTVQERREKIRGFFYSPFRIDDLLGQIVDGLGSPQVDFNIYDGETTDSTALMHRSVWNERGNDNSTPRLTATTTMTLADNTWTLEFLSRPEFDQVSERRVIPFLALVGTLFSLGIFFITFSQVKAYERLEEATLQLKKSQEDFAQLNDQLEQRVRERTARLQGLNEELEAFAYSVSHDLRAPLRGIDGFSKFLLEDYGDRFDETGKDYLHRIRDGATRMGQLIDALLMLSRVTRWKLTRQRIDLSEMVGDIAEKLREKEPGRNARFDIEEGVIAYGDYRLLRVAIENLLENAWKFTGKKEETLIGFTTRVEDGETIYSIRDNGAGFDEEYAGIIFESFRRFHSPSEFPGSGIGLATVKRVIMRHNGSISASGRVNEGATFSFTLGTNDPNSL